MILLHDRTSKQQSRDRGCVDCVLVNCVRARGDCLVVNTIAAGMSPLTGPHGASARSSVNGLVGTRFASR